MRAALITCLFGVLLGGLWLWIFPPAADDGASPADADKVHQDISPAKVITDTIVAAPQQSSLFTQEHLAHCRQVLTDYEEHQLLWLEGRDIEWNELLRQGYPLQDVAAAMGFVHSTGLASYWYLEHKRWDALNARLTELLGSESELIMQRRVNLVPDIPQPLYLWYADLDRQARDELLLAHPPSVDDVAYFISSATLPEDELMNMLGRISEPERVVIWDELNTTSLLDYAVYYGYPEVVDWLLGAGVTPSEDPFLPTTLDWALSRLASSTDQAGLSMLQRVLDTGNGASLATADQQQLSSVAYSQGAWQFSAQQAEALHAEAGIALSGLPVHTSVLSPDSFVPLRHWFAEQKQDHLASVFGTAQVNALIDRCQQVVQTLSPPWQPEDISGLMQALKQSFSGEALNDALAAVDPSLVGCGDEGPDSRIEPISDSLRQAFYHRLYESGVEDFADWVEDQQLGRAQGAGLFVEIINDYPEALDAFARAGWVPEQFDYDWLAYFVDTPLGVTALIDAGYDLYSLDSNGHPALLHAIRHGKREIAEALLARQFPVRSAPGREDALHALLSPYRRFSDVQTISHFADRLLTEGIQLDVFHLQRMQLLKQQQYSVYKALVDAVPVLKVDDSVAVPRAICPVD